MRPRHDLMLELSTFFFFSSRRRHTRCSRDWSSDVCSSDLYRDNIDSKKGKDGFYRYSVNVFTYFFPAEHHIAVLSCDVDALDQRAHIEHTDRKSTRLNSSHGYISYAVFCLKKKNRQSDDNDISSRRCVQPATST